MPLWWPQPRCRIATSPTGSCRTRRSTWWTRRAPGCAPKSTPCQPNWTRSPGGAPDRATLSHRYITDRFLPDKAIDLVDEACARLRTEIDSLPAELDEITRRVTRLEIEEVSLAKESDPASKARLEDLRKELADLRAEADARHAQWDAERPAIKRVRG